MYPYRRIRQFCTFLFAACLCLAPYHAGAATFDGKKPLLCAMTKALSCDSDEGCEPVTLEEIQFPPFFKIDLRNGTASGVGLSGTFKPGGATIIASQQRMDGKLFLQGVERRAWSVAINESNGKMTLSVSGDDEAFVIFGNCLAID